METWQKEAEDFRADRIPEEQPYTGRREVWLPDASLDAFKTQGAAPEEVYTVDDQGIRQEVELTENEFLLLRSHTDSRKTMLGRYAGGRITRLRYGQARPFGVRPRSVGQQFLQEALLLPAEEAPLVIVQGPAGTAKTFYSLAAGLEQVLEQSPPAYRKILICRPNAQFDTDIGFLPGDEQEKISPLMRPIMDNLEQLIDSDEEARYQDEQELQGKIEEIFARGIIQAEAMNFIRGRSFVNTYLIIDEAQNMTPNQVKGIITRAGKGTKIVLLGDPNQIDRPFLDERTNGLSYASEYMKGSPLCYQITMSTEECERSELAMDAIQRL